MFVYDDPYLFFLDAIIFYVLLVGELKAVEWVRLSEIGESLVIREC